MCVQARSNGQGSMCNQAIMLITDGAMEDFEDVFEEFNWPDRRVTLENTAKIKTGFSCSLAQNTVLNQERQRAGLLQLIFPSQSCYAQNCISVSKTGHFFIII